MIRVRLFLVRFVFSLFLLTLLGSWAWQQFVDGTLYQCTDAGWLDYLNPGDWVHNPVSVAAISPYRSMSDPDTILSGWTQGHLLGLWGASIVILVLVSLWLASRRLPRVGSVQVSANC